MRAEIVLSNGAVFEVEDFDKFMEELSNAINLQKPFIVFENSAVSIAVDSIVSVRGV